MEIYVVIIYIYIYTWVPTSDFTYINMTYMCQSTYCGGLRTPALPKGCLKAKQNNGMFTTYQPVDFWTINIAIIAIIAIIVITNIRTIPRLSPIAIHRLSHVDSRGPTTSEEVIGSSRCGSNFPAPEMDDWFLLKTSNSCRIAQYMDNYVYIYMYVCHVM